MFVLCSLFFLEIIRGYRYGLNVVNKLIISGWVFFIKCCVMFSVMFLKKISMFLIGVVGYEIERKICFVDVLWGLFLF